MAQDGSRGIGRDPGAARGQLGGEVVAGKAVERLAGDTDPVASSLRYVVEVVIWMRPEPVMTNPWWRG